MAMRMAMDWAKATERVMAKGSGLVRDWEMDWDLVTVRDWAKAMVTDSAMARAMELVWVAVTATDSAMVPVWGHCSSSADRSA